MTDIETVRHYCLSLPEVTEDMAFGDDFLLLRVCNKIFAGIAFERDKQLVLKCNPDLALELRDKYPEIDAAWHWNKKYWNEIDLSGRLGERFVHELIRHSYSEVVKKLGKTQKIAFPAICTVFSSLLCDDENF